jgi:DNA invertase Pin-like site-specific DNA recombinase
MRRLELPAGVLERRAIVYVRQSTSIQVEENLESQRRQYELADHARTYGFRDIVVIDDDLGISASGTHARPGFESLVRQICEGVVGAVFCLEASRLARNGRDWHHLLELCGLVGARVFDADGVYDPSLPNDRLLLGLKGTMSEFELTVMRRRLIDAAVAKARRGELRIGVPVGSSGNATARWSSIPIAEFSKRSARCFDSSIGWAAHDKCCFACAKIGSCSRGPTTASS